MSRSNTPSGHNGQHPPALVPGAQGQQQWRMPPELEVPPSRGAPGQLPAAGQYAQPGQLPPGYAYPPQTYGQVAGAVDQGYGYAAQPPALGGHQFAPPPAAAPVYAPQERYAAQSQVPELRGSQFDQWPVQATATPAANPQNYDLGNYNPALPGNAQTGAYQQPVNQYAQPPSTGHSVGMPDFNQPPQSPYASAAYGNYAPPQAEYPQQQWSPQDIAAYQAQQAGQHGAVNYDQQGYASQPQVGYPAAGQQLQGVGLTAGQVQAAGQYDDEEEFEEEEPRRRGRGLMVVAALVGAIGLGGGLAYGYKTYMKPPTSGSIPVARADKNPAKIKPATPDGKQMAGSSSALQNGADASAPIRPVQAAATANADTEGSASRKVQTMQIGRDGSIAAPAQQQTQSTTVPGMQMVFPSTPTQQRVMPVPNLPVSQPVAPPAPIAQAVQPRVPAPINAPVAAAPAPAQPKMAQLPVPKKPTTRDDLAASGGSALGAGEAAPAAAPRKPSGAGFMPVISLQKTEIDAMRTWADLQDKIPALQGKKPITQVIEPGSKYSGMYRLMVGPPGSSAAARDTCGQLKPAGINDCYVAAY